MRFRRAKLSRHVVGELLACKYCLELVRHWAAAYALANAFLIREAGDEKFVLKVPGT